MTTNKENPCKRDCPDRHVGCHSECSKYIEFDEENKKRREANLIRQYGTKYPKNKTQR